MFTSPVPSEMLFSLDSDIIWVFSYFTEEYVEVNGIGPTFLTKLNVALSLILKGFSVVILRNKNKILNF